MNNIKLSLIAGGTASGKTTIAKNVHNRLLDMNINSLLISQDDYTICPVTDVQIKDIEKYDFDKPYAIDTRHLFSDITQLIEGNEIMMPKYYFGAKGKEYDVISSGQPEVILLEGTFVLYYEYLTQLAKSSIFVDVDEDIRLDRRLKRDVVERNLTVEQITNRFNNFVKPNHDRYIQPSINNSNYIIKNNIYDEEDLIRQILN